MNRKKPTLRTLGEMMLFYIDKLKLSRKQLYIGIIILILALLIGLAASISRLLARLDGIAPQFSEPIVVEQVNDLHVERQIRSMYCLDDGKVDYAIIDLFPKGGDFPYTYIIEDSLAQVQGPFSVPDENVAISIVLGGGEAVSVTIWSADSDEPDWIGTISVPIRDSYCDNTQPLYAATLSHTLTYTLTLTPTITETPTITLTPTITFTPTSSLTSTITPIISLTPTFTYTPTPTFTFTPTRTPTYTPTSTFTLTPTPTFTPTFTQTITFTPSSRWECSDGIDNDGDGLIDYGPDETNDPECTFLHDNHEDR